MIMFYIISLLIVPYVIYRLYKSYFSPSDIISPDGKYVLITGCGSGFGYSLAIELDKQGFNVFASVHNVRSEVLLKKELSARSTAFVLDVTNQEDIERALTIVKEKTNILHALVNNAGRTRSAYIDWMTMELFRQTMDVNFFGHVAMTKKFLPLLIAKRNSRVINVSSISGFASFGSTSAYASSKYALEAFSDCLRREMIPWGLRVSIIEPGGMQTPFFNGHETFLRTLWNELSTDVQQRWGETYASEIIKQIVDNPFTNNLEDPMKAVRAIQHAVTSEHPQIRYRPGWQAKLIFLIFSVFPAWLVDKLLSSNIKHLVPTGVHNQQIN